MVVSVESLVDVYKLTGELINDVYEARNIFFEEDLREDLKAAYKDFQSQFQYASEGLKGIDDMPWETTEHPFGLELASAGLVGAQKTFKLKSFAASYSAYRTYGTVKKLIVALKKGKTILASLGGGVPYVGSFIQEFIDFLLSQLEREDR